MKEINDEIKLPVDGPLDLMQQVREQLIEHYCTQMKLPVPDPRYFPDDDSLNYAILQIMLNYFEPDTEKKLIEMMNQKQIFPVNQPNDFFSFQELYQLDAACNYGMELPDSVTLYTIATDVMPACTNLYEGTGSREELLASLGFVFHPVTAGFYFRDESVFESYKAFLSNFLLPIQKQISKADSVTLADVQQMKLDDLLAGFWLRGDITSGNKSYSFQRIIYSSLLEFASGCSDEECGVLPFSVSEFFCPKSITLINLQNHAEASEMSIRMAWTEHLNALTTPVQPISGQKMSQLNVYATDLNHSFANAQKDLADFLKQKNADPMLRMNQTFSKTRPTPKFYMKKIDRHIQHMKDCDRSQNVYKRQAKSYAKPNRRSPDDPNRKGIKKKKFYKPDIHIYADTSGSISEEDYITSCEMAVLIAQKWDVDLYFNSFSHELSETSRIKVKGRSTKQVLDHIHNLNKVTGGTDYEPVWDYINASKKRRKELSIVISDFEVSVPSYGIKHPQNILYIPCALTDWNCIRKNAERFALSMYRYDPAIRRKLCL